MGHREIQHVTPAGGCRGYVAHVGCMPPVFLPFLEEDESPPDGPFADWFMPVEVAFHPSRRRDDGDGWPPSAPPGDGGPPNDDGGGIPPGGGGGDVPGSGIPDIPGGVDDGGGIPGGGDPYPPAGIPEGGGGVPVVPL